MIGKGPIKLAIFDNDGTLMDTETVYSIAHKEVTGYDLEWDFKVQLMGKTGIEACRLTCEHHGLTESPESLLARRTEVVSKHWPNVKLMPGAEKVVKELKKRGIKMAIATAASRESFGSKAQSHKDFVGMMDYIICAEDVKRGKPEPDLFLKALSMFKEFDIKPEEALVFEDSALGIKAANLAGMPSVFIPDPHVNVEDVLKKNEAKPDLIISSFEEFDLDKVKWETV